MLFRAQEQQSEAWRRHGTGEMILQCPVQRLRERIAGDSTSTTINDIRVTVACSYVDCAPKTGVVRWVQIDVVEKIDDR
jgi:hypothetical protein